MFSVVLFQPEIPPNTGNIIRLCANTGSSLNLIEPLGFKLEEKLLRRAGLDYHEYTDVQTWPNWDAFETQSAQETPNRLISFSTKSNVHYSDYRYQRGDHLIFGSETSGLPEDVRQRILPENRLTIPMFGETRSLNLSNSVAIVVYEAWRQHNFKSC
ncbi:MAG: tRNA (uridine(34)/cytosine(34)/5-carboxymethylaminomethyluridine(34)-2'-O)-methyltransferase TrmL [Gammaproteobacteria bacterium]|nr:tRNA (uridine(34)/cytosine(34)/5-carboxymethylaminomethyluridine(34)-2'-O)-methyltransferase TrmL [Gammaproteobacteria bacterium]